jgi:hypothetical protein
MKKLLVLIVLVCISMSMIYGQSKYKVNEYDTQENIIQEYVTVYPNPFAISTTVTSSIETGYFKVCDMSGKVINSGKFISGKNYSFKNTLPETYYILVIYTQFRMTSILIYRWAM